MSHLVHRRVASSRIRPSSVVLALFSSLTVGLGALGGCSDAGHHTASCNADECGMDAGSDLQTHRDAGHLDAAIKPGMFVITDGGAGGELQARVQVNGATVPCGACAILLVQAQGGVGPYSYAWDDPTLSGPGPQRVCPSVPTTYNVVVTDSTATTSGEFSQTAQQVQVSGEVDCVADAGIPDDDLQGCITPVAKPNDGGTDAGADAGPYGPGITCAEPNDAGVSFDLTTGAVGTVTVSTKIADADSNFSVFKAGKTYTYIADRFLPITLSLDTAILVDIYGAKSHCSLDEKLFTLKYDLFTWHQAYCFTPREDYDYLIVSVHLNGAVFNFDLFESATICAGCTEQSTP